MTDFEPATAPEAYLQERLIEAVTALRAAHRDLSKAGYGGHYELMCTPEDCWLLRDIEAALGNDPKEATDD